MNIVSVPRCPQCIDPISRASALTLRGLFLLHVVLSAYRLTHGMSLVTTRMYRAPSWHNRSPRVARLPVSVVGSGLVSFDRPVQMTFSQKVLDQRATQSLKFAGSSNGLLRLYVIASSRNWDLTGLLLHGRSRPEPSTQPISSKVNSQTVLKGPVTPN